MPKQNFRKVIFTVLIIIITSVLMYYYFDKRGLIEFFSSKERIQNYVQSFGILAPVAFFALQTLQVIFAPIPGNVITIAGGIVFGFWVTFILSSLSIISGSIVCFFLAKNYGKPLVIKLIGKKTVDKYLNTLFTKKKAALYFMFLLPFFPDDALCLIAGLTLINFKSFLLLIVFTRPWGIIFSSLIGSEVITISTTGWIIIITICMLTFILSLKFSDSIENKMVKWYKRY